MSVLVDTGATDSFFREFFRSYLRKRKKSKTKILIADSTIIQGECDGDLPIFAVNTTTVKDGGLGKEVSLPVTIVPAMEQDLLSVTHFFVELGYEIHLRPRGACEMTRTLDDGTIDRIALRWDAHERGFYMDIIVSRDPRNHEVIAAHLLDQQDLRTQDRVNARQASTLPSEKVAETLIHA